MSRLACWFVRAALLNLLVGTAIGAALLWDIGLPFASWPWRLLALHREALLFGWLAQITLGVAGWILPRPEGSRGSGSEMAPCGWRRSFGWAALVLLNLGIWVSAVGGWFGWGQFEVAGKAVEALSAMAFALYLWPRIRGLPLKEG